MAYRLLPQAKSDIEEITSYIAADSLVAAQRWFDHLQERFVAIGAMPEMAPTRPEIGPYVRLFPFDRYVMLYRAESGDADIVRIVHGSRDPETWL